MKDFADRCQGIVNEAMKWAPKSTKSHLQEYPNQLPTSGLAHHSGLALAFDAVLQSCPPSLASSLMPLATQRPACVNSDTPRFVSVLCLRSKYAGEISGLLSVLDDDDKKGLADRLVKDVWDACNEKSDAKHRGALWRATAYLIICSGINRKLLHAVCKYTPCLVNRALPTNFILMFSSPLTHSYVSSGIVHTVSRGNGR